MNLRKDRITTAQILMGEDWYQPTDFSKDIFKIESMGNKRLFTNDPEKYEHIINFKTKIISAILDNRLRATNIYQIFRKAIAEVDYNIFGYKTTSDNFHEIIDCMFHLAAQQLRHHTIETYRSGSESKLNIAIQEFDEIYDKYVKERISLEIIV